MPVRPRLAFAVLGIVNEGVGGRIAGHGDRWSPLYSFRSRMLVEHGKPLVEHRGEDLLGLNTEARSWLNRDQLLLFTEIEHEVCGNAFAQPPLLLYCPPWGSGP